MKLLKKFVISTLTLGLLLSVALNLLLIGRFEGAQAHAGKLSLRLFGELTLVQEVLNHIKQNFVEPDKTDNEKLIHGAVQGMLQPLEDPYSRFMPPVAYKEMQIETQGSFGGLGIIIGQREKAIVVIAPLVNTPAYRAGIEAEDQIVKIDGEPVKGMNVNDVANKLRGVIGTKVRVSLYRASKKKLVEVDIVRESIHVPSVSARMLDHEIGYIYLSSFIQTSAEDVEKKLDEFVKAGMTGLVLDLRHNPGGLLEAAVAVGRLLLPAGSTIVTVRDAKENEARYASFGNGRPRFPIVVLIDAGSASASEILAGAIQDHKRGILIGTKSFGKGSVQTVLPLSDGSALALTTAYYYTPSGKLIHNKGLNPDFEVQLPKMTDEEIRKLREERSKFLAETAEGKEPEKVDMAFLEKFDSQFSRAIDVLISSKIFLEQVKSPVAGAKN